MPTDEEISKKVACLQGIINCPCCGKNVRVYVSYGGAVYNTETKKYYSIRAFNCVEASRSDSK